MSKVTLTKNGITTTASNPMMIKTLEQMGFKRSGGIQQQQDPEELAQLVEQAQSLGIKVDSRWGVKTLRKEIDKELSKAEQAENQ